MSRKLAALLLALVMAFTLFGCSTTPPAETPAPSPSVEATATPSPEASAQPSDETVPSAFPVTVTDAAGREVTIEEEPQTIVSGYYITTSMLLALDQSEKMVGIEAKADTRPIYSLAAPALLDLPNVGTAKEFNLEGCAALEPDLVVLPLKLKDNIEPLEALGITVLTANPESLEMLADTITMLGNATGAADQAKALLDYNAQTADELNKMLAEAEKPTVYLAGNSDYLSTAGAQMYQNTLIEMGGGSNVAAEIADTYWAEVSYEQLLAWNPSVIIIAPGAKYTKDDLIADAQLADIDAIKNGNVYVMPSSFEAWDSPVPSALLGSRWMASVLHEDAYAFDAFKADAATFYNTFYGIDIDQQLLTK